MRANVCGRDNISRAILEALSEIRQVDVDGLEDEMAANGGNLNIGAKEQAAIVAMLEVDWGCGPLLKPSDFNKPRKQANSCLSPLTETTVSALTDLLLAKVVGDGCQGEGKDGNAL